MKRSAILVLGATGFAGFRLVQLLASEGTPVYALSRTAHKLPAMVNVETFSQPLDNVTLLEKLLPTCRMVFHLASDSTPGSSAWQPALEAGVNLIPTLRLLEVMQRHPHIPIVYASSGGATYASNDLPLTEESPVHPPSYYGAGKVAIEEFLFAYTKQCQGRALILRPSNLYGPGQRFKRGFGIVPTIFHHTLNGTPMEIWGNGEVVRDYLYVGDFIRLCVAIANTRELGQHYAVYNVGYGSGTTINEVCAVAEAVTEIPLQRKYVPGRAIDSSRIELNCDRALSDFGWRAQTDLIAGLQETWHWFKTHAA